VPDVDVTTNFFLALTFVANAVVAVAVLAGVAALFSPRARAAWRRAAVALAPQAVPLAWIVAVVTTLGSLYYSEHAGFIPCELCWYQRILMYPLVIVLGVAWLRRDAKVWMTALVFVALGAPLSLYHWLVERVPSFASTSSCSVAVPCTAPWFEKLGYVTLAWMAMSSFLLIGALLICAAVGLRVSEASDSETAEAVDTVNA
jgi:disulfide bond formation protein DsbB